MKVFPVLSALALLCASQLVADTNTSLEGYLSKLKQRSFDLDFKKNEEESLKLRDSWISPLQLSYSYIKSEPYDNEQTSMNAMVSIDQPIFKFGGIYYGIKYANAALETNNLTIDQQKRALIKQAVSLLMQIKQSELQIKVQKLRIDNATINLQQQQQLYINGQLDSGFLNNAVIEKNVATQTLFDLEAGYERLVSSFQSISDVDYKNAVIPHLEYIERNTFMANNIDLQLRQSTIERDYNQKRMTVAKYFPQLSAYGTYKWERSESVQFGNTGAGYSGETHYASYGLKASLPLSINTFRDIESANVDYLKAKVAFEDSKREQNALFDQVKQNLNNFDKKIALARENQVLYETLVHDTKILFDSGYKTEYDLKNMENSLEIERLNVRIYEYDIQQELLNLYEKLYRDF
jgi:outer membrane protein TolC